MLFSFYPLITQNYFICLFVVCLGTLQWVAARNRRLKLSPLGPWGLGRMGAIIGVLLIIGGFGWFFVLVYALPHSRGDFFRAHKAAQKTD